MKSITLWEPWATAMSLELKRNETRSWSTKHTGWLAICSAQRRMTAFEQRIFDDHVKPYRPDAEPQYGKVLCVVNMYGVARTADCRGVISATEFALGDYTPGRWAWLTHGCVRLLEPVLVVGRQGLFDLPMDVELNVLKQMKG